MSEINQDDVLGSRNHLDYCLDERASVITAILAALAPVPLGP
jgi:hypothetical protein